MPTKKERALFEEGQVVSLHDIDQEAEEYMYSRYNTGQIHKLSTALQRRQREQPIYLAVTDLNRPKVTQSKGTFYSCSFPFGA